MMEQEPKLHRQPLVCTNRVAALDPRDRSPGSVTSQPYRYGWLRFLKDRYAIVRNLLLSPHLKRRNPGLAQMKFDQLLNNEGGLSFGRRRELCSRFAGNMSGKTVLIVGCGWGEDTLTWLPHRPARIIAVDLFNYRRCWDEVTALARAAGVSISFVQFDLTAATWDFVDRRSVDVVSSDAVLEHITDIPGFMSATRGVLRPGGKFYAGYGPLWYGPLGDHIYSPDPDDAFNHLLLDDQAYACYVARIEAAQAHLGNACEGPFLLRHALFSYLKVDDYLKIFASAGFGTIFTQVKVATWLAGRFRRRFPEKYEKMRRQQGLRDADLFALGCHAWLRHTG
jgi:SAM-dependent methyltransferase